MAENDLWATWLPIVISSIALLLSLGSFVYAVRTFGINKRRESGEAPNLDLYYDGGFKTPIGEHDCYEFGVQVSNISASNNMLNGAVLEISYERDGVPSVMQFESTHSPEHVANAGVIAFPHKLSAAESVQGLLRFDISRAAIGRGRAKGYRVVIKDARGVHPSFTPIFLSPRPSNADLGKSEKR